MTVQDVLTNPIFIGLMSAAAMTVASAVAAYFVKRDKRVETVAVGLADYNEKLQELMSQAEATGLPGPLKLKQLSQGMEDWLTSIGVKGEAKRVTMERVQKDVEWLVPLVFPKNKPADPATPAA